MTKMGRSLVLLAVAGCWSCSDPAFLNVPTSPSATVPTETARGSGSPIVEPLRRVEEGSGGGEVCYPPECIEYPGGRVHLTASGGSLQGEYSGVQFQDDIYRFSGEVGLAGSGRLAGINGGMNLGVGGTAHLAGVYMELTFPGGIQQIRGSAVPTFSLENDGQCPSGRRLTTRFELTLEYLGQTTVTDTHCTAT